MSTYINDKKYNDVIDKLQYYMLDENTINRSLDKLNNSSNNISFNKPNNTTNSKSFVKSNNSSNNSSNNTTNNNSNNKSFENNDIFAPNQKDTLFWCFYILKYGESNYEMLDNINIVLEKKLKIDYVEKIRKEKQIVKSHKFATLTHLENQLANEVKIDINTFFTLCVIENINVLYVSKKIYFELLMNDDKIHIIHRLDNYSKYGYEGISQSKIELYRSTLFKVDNVEKPVKTISAYKVSELVEFCSKLGIEICIKDTNKNKSKKDLYESLIQYF
jgi:hypothetical protein